MIPEGYEIGYECENGHVNDDHDTKPLKEKGKRCVCEDCGALITRTLIPLRECEDCGNVWSYTGSADRPTCPACHGKRTSLIAD